MALNKALGTDLSALAQIIKSKGRGRDTVLAHITPQEAALLKRRGGRGSINPDTGLPEFQNEGDAQVETAPATETSPTEGTFQMGSGTRFAPSSFGYQAPSSYTIDGQAGVAPGQYASTDFYQPATGGMSASNIATASLPGIAEQRQLQTSLGQTVSPVTGELVSPQPTKPTEQTGFFDKALESLQKPDTLGRLGLAGALGAYGAMQGKKAAGQSEAATAQKQAIAAPYQQQGQELVRAAQAGELTPANQQVIQQQRARLAQASANMGGVGQQQIENQISSLTSQLLQNQYQYGLQVMQIGDNIALGAINTQLQLDQQLTQANKSFYTSLAQLAAGSPMYVPGLTSVTPTRT